ncbi:hypothetical protein FRC07_014395 [Ceratobasidium sp. 392]|nr:hypothetical protein FRC07_014395 [Ceratobasidium sp. 392]
MGLTDLHPTQHAHFNGASLSTHNTQQADASLVIVELDSYVQEALDTALEEVEYETLFNDYVEPNAYDP